MPDRPLTVATYAAGASLAAITLFYVFGPTFFLDDEASQSSKASRRKGVVGLVNPANDCFINSVLQTLAGLPELRVYLIRELHRRKIEGGELDVVVREDGDDEGEAEREKRILQDGRIPDKPEMPEWKALGLQRGLVTAALKDVLDALNERPIYKKTISAGSFVSVLEQAFRTRINRNQQDAQEFLQIVTERLCDEFYAAEKVRRRREKKKTGGGQKTMEGSEETIKPKKQAANSAEGTGNGVHKEDTELDKVDAERETAFPFEGRLEAQIECTHCRFKPKPSTSTFVTLTLHVPQLGHPTSLNTCFDGMLKVEHIDDFKCERCRLEHAIETKEKELVRTTSEKRPQLDHEITVISKALAEDPEKCHKDANLPDISLAPKRQIARHMRISSFPRVLAIHLSRSMFDVRSVTTKNLAKVTFPETLPLGGLLDRVSYRLLGVVTHKGGHNSGHYESFRRQMLREPYSTPTCMGSNSRVSPDSSVSSQSPRIKAEKEVENPSTTAEQSVRPETTTRSDSSTTLSSQSSQSRPGGPHLAASASTPTAPTEILTTGNNDTAPSSLKKTESQSSKSKSIDLSRLKRKQKRQQDRWWRISDDKIKEASTKDVLGMQREVYLLFYELITDGP